MDIQQVNWWTMTPSLIVQSNAVALEMGVYHLTNTQLDAWVKLLSLVIGLAGIVLSHRKAPQLVEVPVVTPQPVEIKQPTPPTAP